jgi:hypothetical protein
MAFTTTLWNVKDDKLHEVPKHPLESEKRLEDWIEQDASVLGMDVLIIGRQVQTPFGGRIDLLGIAPDGSTVIIELKRDKTPRDIVAQVLDYASWARTLTPHEIDERASDHLKKPLAEAFKDRFDASLPENVGADHRMVIVASELDESSERIVQYLSSEYSVDINAIFFTCFQHDGEEFVGRSWLLDPDVVEERMESRRKIPWSGFWFVNVGENGKDPHRSWDDCRKYGFLSAGGGSKYSHAIRKLKAGAKVFAYLSGHGYVGFGTVLHEAIMVKDFEVDGRQLLGLLSPVWGEVEANAENPEMTEWVAAIQWQKTFSREQAKKGSAYRNVVCKLGDPGTVDVLRKEFDVDEQ